MLSSLASALRVFSARATPSAHRAALAVPLRNFASSSQLAWRPSFTSREASEPLPWFVDAPATPAPTTEPSRLATSPEPTPPPPHLPATLHPLHDHLSISPFFDREGLSYINAREADPEGSWVDWVVLATLREGRERGIRGAAEGVRVFLAKTPLDLASPSADNLASPPFSPTASSPLVSGLAPSPSKHARSRRKGPPPTRADQATGWAMVDAGRVVVHIMTPEARGVYGRGVEEVWDTQEGTVARRRMEAAARERELEENMRAVEEEEALEAEESAGKAEGLSRAV
ncbi:hypothetical protein JCM11641_002898 [Rhodosporidiobolus odoratus]